MSEMLHTFSSIFRGEKITLAKFMRAKIARIRTEAESDSFVVRDRFPSGPGLAGR